MPTGRIIAYRFAQCEIHLQKRTVVVCSQERRIGRKVFDLLVALVENRHRVVKREELARIGWLGGSVSDVALSRAVTRCRQAIASSDEDDDWIQAQWGLGYRFMKHVDPVYADAIGGSAVVSPVRGLSNCRAVALLPVCPRPGGDGAGFAGLLKQAVAKALQAEPAVRLLDCDGDDVTRADCLPESVPDLLRQVWARMGSVSALSVQLTGSDASGSARWLLCSPDGSVMSGTSENLAGAEPLAMAIVQAVRKGLARLPHPALPLDLPDAFAIEACIRALSDADQWHWHKAQRLAHVVCDSVPDSLGAQALLLRTLLHTHSRAAIGVGERLLEHARNRVAPECLASVHLALGQSLKRVTDVDSHAQSLSHLEAAVALAEGKPPELWTVRAHVALAGSRMLGDRCSRDRARQLFLKAASLADQCGDLFMAAVARSNLAYLMHHDGHVERSLRLHEDLLQQVESRGLDVPTAFALTMKAELVRAWGQLSSAQSLLDLAWRSLTRVPIDDRAQAGAFMAYVQTALALDRCSVPGVTQAMQAAPDIEQCHPRQRVYLAIALGRSAFVDGQWDVCRDWLAKAEQIADKYQLHQMCCPPLVMTAQLGMAVGDSETVSWAATRLESLNDAQKRVATESEAIRARAWLALKAGRVHEALRLLMPIALSAHEAYSVYLARLDAAWLVLQQGSPERAHHLLSLCAHWPVQSPLGALTAMAVSQAQGRHSEARERLSLLKMLWHGHWPSTWTSPDAIVRHWADQLPSHGLLGLMAGAGQPQLLTSVRAA